MHKPIEKVTSKIRLLLLIIKNELISRGYTNKFGNSLFGGSKVSIVARFVPLGQISSLAQT